MLPTLTHDTMAEARRLFSAEERATSGILPPGLASSGAPAALVAAARCDHVNGIALGVCVRTLARNLTIAMAAVQRTWCTWAGSIRGRCRHLSIGAASSRRQRRRTLSPSPCAAPRTVAAACACAFNSYRRTSLMPPSARRHPLVSILAFAVEITTGRVICG